MIPQVQEKVLVRKCVLTKINLMFVFRNKLKYLMNTDHFRTLCNKMALVINVPPGKKIDFEHSTYSDPKSWKDVIFRTLSSDNRNDAAKSIEALVNNCVQDMALYKDMDLEYFHLTNQLSALAQGIERLRATYQADKQPCPIVDATFARCITIIRFNLENNDLPITPSSGRCSVDPQVTYSQRIDNTRISNHTNPDTCRSSNRDTTRFISTSAPTRHNEHEKLEQLQKSKRASLQYTPSPDD